MLEDLILFVDGEAIVIDKPAGLPVDHPRAGGDSIEARIGELTLGFARPPVAMHRLDRDTSGCLLFARNHKSRARYQQAFETGMVTKSYIAVVDGETPGEEGLIDLPVAKRSSAARGWRMVVEEGGKEASTRWRWIGSIDGQSLVEFLPATGRTHQIRIHAARAGWARRSSVIRFTPAPTMTRSRDHWCCPTAGCCSTLGGSACRASPRSRST